MEEQLQLISTIEMPYNTIEGECLVIFEQYIYEDKIKSYRHKFELNDERVETLEYIDTFDTLEDAHTYIENNLI
tara:strand:+ start:1608 stop:1829 length:222 start_codon:yes stop_codon:yes gene_type:complete